MPDIIITPSSGKLEFVDISEQVTRRHAFTLDHSDGIKLDAPLSATSIAAPVNIINVTVNNSNVNYPFVLASGSAETGTKTLMMDGSGGTYNPFTNTATIDISGNSATTTLASNSSQLNGQSAAYYTNITARLGYTPVNQAGDTISGNLTVNGNFAVNGSVTAFSASNIYITSSTLTVTDNILLMNALSPYQRYAGIQMYDSGSGTLSQFLWDGEGDYFFLTGSSVNGKIITGPDGQTNLSSNYIPKATAGYKLGNSLIYDNGTNVGIGTTTPSGKLSTGATSGMKLLVYDNAATGVYTGLGQDLAAGNSTDLFAHSVSNLGFITFGKIGTNGSTYTEWARFNTSGSLGIGTNNPSYKLDVTGSLGVNASSTDNNWPFVVSDNSSAGSRYSLNKYGSMGFNNADNYAQLQLLGSAGAYVDFTNSIGGDSNARLIYYAGSRLDLTYGFATTITLNGTGVGIGTTGPNAKLDVNGNAIVTGSLTTTSTIVARNYIMATDTLYIQKGVGGYQSYITAEQTSAGTGNSFKFWNSGTATLMTIGYNGYVGIGTTSPTYQLHVNGGPTEVGGQVVAAFEKQSSTDGKIATFVNTTGSGYTSYIYIGSNPGRDWKIGKNVLNSGTTGHFQITNDLNQLKMQINASDDTITFPSASVGIGTTSPNTKLAVNGVSSFGPSSKLSMIGLDINSSGTPTYIKIVTTIPVASPSADFTVNIKGFVYGAVRNADISISWHYYLSTFYNPIAKSSGGWAPTIRLSAENGFVAIVLSSPGYWPKFYVESMYSSAYTNQYASGWSWTDADATGNPIVNVPYASNFGNGFVMLTDGNVGIGTTGPVSKFEMFGGEMAIKLSANTTSSFQWKNSSGTKIQEIRYDDSDGSMTLGGVGGYPIKFITSTTEKMRVNGDGNVGIGITSPTTKLHVVGVISGSSFSGAGTGLTGTASSLTAGTANSVAWTNVSSRPTAVSAFTNDSLYQYHRGDITSLSSSATNVVQPLGTFDGSNITNAPTSGWYNYLSSTHGNYLTSLIANLHRSADWYVGYKEGPGGTPTNPSWYKLLHSGNYTDYTVTKTGTGASGTWAITSSLATTAVTALNVGNGTITIAAGTGVGVGTTNTFTTNQSGATTVTVTNTGVTSNVAGTGISVSGATGAVTITNSGVTSAVAGTGVGVSGATGAVTFSIGQAVGTGNSPTFAGLISSGNVGIGTTSATARLHVSGSTGGVFEVDTAGGTTNLYVSASGNIGIGTTNPVSKLDVYGPVSLRGTTVLTTNFDLNGSGNTNDIYGNIRVLRGASLNDGMFIGYGGAGGPLRFFSNNGTTEFVTIATSGFVGIGSTAPAALLNIRASAPTSTGTVTTGTNILIDSNTSSYITFRNTADNGTYAGLTFLDNNTGGYIIFRNYTGDVATGSDSMIYGTYQDHIFQNGSSETINGKTETMRIKGNGYVGIGTFNPSAKLHVFQSNSGGVAAILLSQDESTIQGPSANTQIRMGSNLVLNASSIIPISTNGSERVRIDSSGNVGIGTSSAGRKLDVEGIVRTRGASGTGGFEIGAASSGAAKWRIEWDSASDSLDFNWVG